MTERLRDLIRQVRQCKTQQEERNVISKESAALRQAFKEQDSTHRHRNVAKLMYIHMLGYPTHFGQMETLKLIASSGFPEKRVGYLGLMILLDERQEVLMLVTNSLKNDLHSKNQYTVGLALTALGNICSAEMARDLAPEVEKLMQSSNQYIRKKAVLCARRVLRKVPDMLESFADKVPELLLDRNHGVLLAALALMLDMCEMEPAVVDLLRPHVPAVCRILRNLLVTSYSPEYDVGGVTDPFLQVKALRLLAMLGKGNAEASDQMSDVLAQVASNIEGGRNASNAVLYECVQTIMGVESVGGLRVLAVNILGRFLANRDNNIRYVALNTLAKVVSIDAQAVQRHRTTIVECVKDADISIRRRALELVYALVNEGNILTLTKELLEYLNVCDVEFKPDLTSKICMLVQRYAPDQRWYIETLAQLLVQAGAYVKEEACRALTVVITNAAQLHVFAVWTMYTALKSKLDAAQPALLMVATWCIGEYGELLTASSDGAGSSPLSESEPVDVVEAVLKKPDLPLACKEYAITALAKLAARLPGSAPRISALLAPYQTSPALEVQTRSVEYTHLFGHKNILPQVLEAVPPLENTVYDAQLDGTDAAQSGAVNGAANDLAALLGLDDAGAAPAAVQAAAQAGGAALEDLFGAAPAAPAASTSSQQGVTFTAHDKAGLKVTFTLSKSASDPQAADVRATYSNTTTEPITNFVLQAAVPKFMQLKLDPASSSELPPLGAATQVLHVVNSMHGTKPLVMRLRLAYTFQGQSVVEQAEVNNFPPGF